MNLHGRKNIASVLIATLALSAMLSGCNFFQKRDDTAKQLPPDEVSNGQSILGLWSYTNATATNTGDPTDARTTYYSFQPNSVVNVIVTDPHTNASICTGFGQYRIWGNDVKVFVQATTGHGCTIPSFTDLGETTVEQERLTFKDNASGVVSYLWAVRNSTPTGPVGLWNFGGQGSIDWIDFDPYGYFLLQTTSNGVMSVIQGFYIVQQGALMLVFFDNQDPAQYSQDALVFDQYITDGQNLILVQGTGSTATQITGVKL